MTKHDFPQIVQAPENTLEEKKYLVRFAQNSEDVDAVLRLRFEVFNLELGEGLDESFETERDQDRFDFSCHHLMVIERKTGNVIGTYRMQTQEMAATGNGFYTATEYDLTQMPDAILNGVVEVGRACIAKAHRNGRVLFLLWRGLAAYMSLFKKQFLFGCCSLTSQDPHEGKQVMDYLQNRGHVRDDFAVPALPGYACYEESFISEKQFKTIDYLVILDIKTMDNRTRTMYFG